MTRFSSPTIFYSIIIIAFLSSAVYWNTLNNDFIWDDDFVIVANESIRSLDLSHIKGFFTSSDPYNFAKGQNYRPLVLISFAFIYKFFGLNPFGYHLANLLLHAINSVMVFLVASLLFNNHSRNTISSKGGGKGRWYYSPAFIAAALFATHPIHTEAVAWVKELDDLLALLLMLIAFCLYIKSTFNSQLLTLNYILSLLFYILALLSKEMVVTLPLILLLYDWLFRKGAGGRSQEIGTISKKQKISHDSRFTIHYLLRYIPFVLITSAYLIIRTLVLGQVGEDKYLIVGGVVLKGMPKFYTMVKGIVYYIKLLILPINLSADYLTFTVSQSMDWQVVLSISILLAILAIAVISYRYSRMVTFSILWFFITVLPVSNIISLRIAIAERFLYMPSMGFCLLLAIVLTWTWKVRPVVSKVMAAVLVVIIILYSSGTIARNRVWRDAYSFWSNLVERFPDNARAHHNLGAAYVKKGLLNEALKEYQEATTLASNYQEAHYHAGDVYRRMGRLDEAINEYRKALLIAPNYLDAHNDIGLVFYRSGQYDEAISHYRRALEIESDNADIHYNLANVYRKKGLVEKAIYEYEEVLRLDSSYSGAYSNLGILYAMQGYYDKAVRTFKDALDISPDDTEARYNLGFAYMKMGDCEAATSEFNYLVERGLEGIVILKYIDECNRRLKSGR